MSAPAPSLAGTKAFIAVIIFEKPYVGSSIVLVPDGHFFMLLVVGAVAFGLAFLELLYYSGTVGKRSYRRQTFCQAFKEELKTALGGSRGENSDSAPSPGVSGIILFPGRAAP